MNSFARWIDENNARLGQDKRRESIRAQLYGEQTTPVGVWVWPCTIIPARYGDVYEGGKWLAFNKEYDDIPAAVHADDLSCSSFFEDEEDYGHSFPIGVGDTPQGALDNLKRKMLEQ